MPVTLTIKQVPDELAARLRTLAARHHRSLQGELMYTLETLAAADVAVSAPSPVPALSVPDAPHPGAEDTLLAELDALVAGSHWGEAPFLGRDQANDRTLTREFSGSVQEPPAQYR